MFCDGKMPQFSTNETVSLEKQVDIAVEPVQTKLEDISDVYEINRCADWIKSSNFQKVCLQFPDHLLPDSSEVVFKLQSILNQTLYILGDTAYESCCIDFVGAAHISADAIIHFGPICFSKTSENIPYINIYEKYHLNVDDLKAAFLENFQKQDEVDNTILVDSPYLHRLDDIVSTFSNWKNVKVVPIDKDPLSITSKIIIFIGKNERKLINIDINYRPKILYYFDRTLRFYEAESRVLKRRNFLVEKIKDSRTIGIIIGTLAIKNYLKVIERIKKLVQLSGKKYYLISVGKPTIAKLANFPEIDIYVMVTCSLSGIYESRDFYKPIATPFDVEIALNTERDENIQFSFDYNNVFGENFESISLKSGANLETDVSLLTNKIRVSNPEDTASGSHGTQDTQVALKSDGTLALNTNYGAGYLAERSWKGLEQNLGQTEVQLAEEGRRGIAQKYENEQT